MVTFEIKGLAEFFAALRALPAELADEGGAIVTEHGAAAEAAIVAGYNAHRHTGNLADHVKSRTLDAGAFGTAVEIRSTAKHAHMFEKGTEARHYITEKNKKKKLVGKMPGLKVFGPTMSRERARMYVALAALLEFKGLEVEGLD